MSRIALSLTKENWWHEINDHPTLSDLTKARLTSALTSFLTYSKPPVQTAEVSPSDFTKITEEVTEITYKGKPLFITAESWPNLLRIRVTNEKSPNWGKRNKVLPTEDLNEGWPRHPVNSIYLIQTWRNEYYYATVDLSQQYMADGQNWQTLRGETFYEYSVLAWIKIC